MTLRSSADVGFLLLGGRSVLSSGVTSVTENRGRILEQTDGLGDSDDKWGSVGQGTYELSQEGFFDAGTGSLHEALETADPQILMFAPLGNIIGRLLVALEAVRTTYAKLPTRGEFHKANASYRAAAGPERLSKARIAAHLVARTAATGQTSSDDWSGDSANGGAVYLAVPALTLEGATNLTVTVEHSVNDSDWTTLAMFTAVITAPTAERKVVTGTINQYTRVTWEFTGTPGGDQTSQFAVGIGRK